MFKYIFILFIFLCMNCAYTTNELIIEIDEDTGLIISIPIEKIEENKQ